MLDFGLTAFVSVLFLVDPPGTVPAFLALTANYTPARRRKTALVACVTATLTLAGFAAVGTYLFRHLGLTLPAFQIAGGLILFLVAVDMVRAAQDPEDTDEMKEGSRSADVAITPLAIPFLAGPAALSTVTVLMARAGGWKEATMVYAAIGLTGVVCYLTLRLAEPIQRRLGTTGIHVLGRVLGLVLAGIAVQFVLDGLGAAGIIVPVKPG
ncbi:MAG: MarC family protein [Fimbriiglobus sp.]